MLLPLVCPVLLVCIVSLLLSTQLELVTLDSTALVEIPFLNLLQLVAWRNTTVLLSLPLKLLAVQDVTARQVDFTSQLLVAQLVTTARVLLLFPTQPTVLLATSVLLVLTAKRTLQLLNSALLELTILPLEKLPFSIVKSALLVVTAQFQV